MVNIAYMQGHILYQFHFWEDGNEIVFLAVTYFLRCERYVPLILQGQMRLCKPEMPGHVVFGEQEVFTPVA